MGPARRTGEAEIDPNRTRLVLPVATAIAAAGAIFAAGGAWSETKEATATAKAAAAELVASKVKDAADNASNSADHEHLKQSVKRLERGQEEQSKKLDALLDEIRKLKK
jgi:hypothetical protein